MGGDPQPGRLLVAGAGQLCSFVGTQGTPSSVGSTGRPVEYDPDAIAVRDALWALPQRQREALVLRYFAGLLDREIADAMGCPVGTVKSLIHRGLIRMKETLR